LAQSVARPP